MNAPVAAEEALRQRLGIPAGAKRVLLFSESSHWDTNWLETSEGYYRARLEPIFEAVLRQLEREPKRVFGIESVFFLKLYWERHPEQRERLRQLFEARRLRLLSSSLTTPDTLLPHAEAVLRDFALGHLWLEEQGLPCEVPTAYFPDNFGHSPHTPSLMQELGVTGVGLTRVDGMYFIAADYRARSDFPLPGSTAFKLEREHQSLDFVWRDDAGAEVLCHWNAFTYFQGDMLAHKGVVRWAGNTFALPWRTRRHVERRIDGYVAQLQPLAKTPYLFCPIGMDFNEPIDRLVELLERYNRERYPDSGTWVTLAGLDDLFALLQAHREKLPVLEVDPNPYWMGFYASRPEVKQRAARTARILLRAEALAASAPLDPLAEEALEEGWATLVLSNHHDYITGTSPDDVWHGEQRPWLQAAEQSAQEALGRASPPPPRVPHVERVHHARHGTEVRVEADGYQLTLCEERGGCLTRLCVGGVELLEGLGFDLVAYEDEGGLWRLGHEFRGGRFHPVARASELQARIEVEQSHGLLKLHIRSHLRGQPFLRTVVCGEAPGAVGFEVEGRAPRRMTVTARFETALRPERLTMDTVGGAIERPLQRLHAPTFWPVPSRLTVPGGPSGRKLHALFDAPTAASVAASGELEWIVARNANKERAFGLLPVLAHPIGGTDDGPQVHGAALLLAPEGPVGEAALRQVRSALEAEGTRHTLARLVHCDTPGVEVAALKRADRGEGLVVRLTAERHHEQTVAVRLVGQNLRGAWRCDAHERDVAALPLRDDGAALVRMTGFLATVRLLPE